MNDRPSAKILLAEDDNDMRRFLVKALQQAGFSVSSFDNGLSAYDQLRVEPFELLLTDIVMPEMDGIELARRATELDPDIKVMFITGFAAVALNPDSQCPASGENPVEALPSARPRDRSSAPAGGLRFRRPCASAPAAPPQKHRDLEQRHAAPDSAAARGDIRQHPAAEGLPAPFRRNRNCPTRSDQPSRNSKVERM